MSITFNTPLGMWHMANYSFAISHAAGLEETSEKPAEPQQWYRERGEECKPCESKMRIQKSIEKKNPANFDWPCESFYLGYP